MEATSVLPPELKDSYQAVYDRLTPEEQSAWNQTAVALGLDVGGSGGSGSANGSDDVSDDVNNSEETPDDIRDAGTPPTEEMDMTQPPTVAQIATLLGLDPATATEETITAALAEKGVELPDNFWTAPLSENVETLTKINAAAVGEDPANAGLAYSGEEAAEIVDILFNPDKPFDPAVDGPRLVELGFPVEQFMSEPPAVSTIASLAGIENFKTISEDELRAELTSRGIDLPADFFTTKITENADNVTFLDQIVASNTTTLPTEGGDGA